MDLDGAKDQKYRLHEELNNKEQCYKALEANYDYEKWKNFALQNEIDNLRHDFEEQSIDIKRFEVANTEATELLNVKVRHQKMFNF